MRDALIVALLILVSFAPPSVGNAQQGAAAFLAQEFDGRLLNKAEKRTLQIALAHTGDYVGLFDGSWGRRSQEALERYSMREYGRFIVPNSALVALVAGLRDAEQRYGFDDQHFSDAGFSLRLPFGHMEEYRKNGELRGWRIPTKGILFDIFRHGRTPPTALHRKTLLGHPLTETPYTVRRRDRLVSSFRREDGVNVYLRSDRGPKGWISLLLLAGEAQTDHVSQIIMSSFYVGPPQAWTRQPQPFIQRLMAMAGASEPAPSGSREIAGSTSSSAASRDKPEKAEQGGGGSGFFISAHDIVTNHHVIESCEGVAATGEQPLFVVAENEKLDLALLRSRDASESWLPLSPADAPLGASVFVLGFPYGEFLSEGVTATRGVLSSRTGLFGDKDQFTLSAQIQPGNSGGPVMNQKGEVIGVVVARLSDGVIADLTGAIPQNVNYAVGRRALQSFLSANGFRAPTGETGYKHVDLTAGIPQSHESSAISVRCFRTSR